jgi:hypothetical protein
LGFGGLGIGDWAHSPIPNPQSPLELIFYIIIILSISSKKINLNLVII